MSEARRTAEALDAGRGNVTIASSAAGKHRHRSETLKQWPAHIKDLGDLVMAMETIHFLTTRDLAGVVKSFADDARANYHNLDPDNKLWPESVKDAAGEADRALSKLRRYLEKAPTAFAHSALDVLHGAVQTARRNQR